MTAQTFLGIDAGGTHTDAVLCGPEGILAGAKAPLWKRLWKKNSAPRARRACVPRTG